MQVLPNGMQELQSIGRTRPAPYRLACSLGSEMAGKSGVTDVAAEISPETRAGLSGPDGIILWCHRYSKRRGKWERMQQGG
jgi:hypothetical protein